MSATPEFNAHSMYVVGEALVDSGQMAPGAAEDEKSQKKGKKPKKEPAKFNGRVAVLFSTDNFLLNGWRASQFSHGVQLCIDATHRLVIEGHGVLVICVVDLAQVTHVLAYGVFTQEDEEGLQHCLAQLKHGVEAAAGRYAKKGWSC